MLLSKERFWFNSLQSCVRPLVDLATFDAIQLHQEIGTLTWPIGVDFGPGTLHDWRAYATSWQRGLKGGRIQYQTNGGPTREWSRRAAEHGSARLIRNG